MEVDYLRKTVTFDENEFYAMISGHNFMEYGKDWCGFERECFKEAKNIVKKDNVIDSVMMHHVIQGMKYMFNRLVTSQIKP